MRSTLVLVLFLGSDAWADYLAWRNIWSSARVEISCKIEFTSWPKGPISQFGTGKVTLVFGEEKNRIYTHSVQNSQGANLFEFSERVSDGNYVTTIQNRSKNALNLHGQAAEDRMFGSRSVALCSETQPLGWLLGEGNFANRTPEGYSQYPRWLEFEFKPIDENAHFLK
jgi:hypothetical protein